MKRQLRINAAKNPTEDPIPVTITKGQRNIVRQIGGDPKISINVEQLKRDMLVENEYVGENKKEMDSLGSASLEADTAILAQEEQKRIAAALHESPTNMVEKKAGAPKKEPVLTENYAPPLKKESTSISEKM